MHDNDELLINRPVELKKQTEDQGQTPNDGPHAHALGLQQTAGNRGVAQLLAGQRLAGADADEHGDAPGVQDVVGRGGGTALDAATRADMESSLGHDFSDVRIHDDSVADASAKGINAHAYTVGNEVVFSSGHYNPASSEGRKTLAHELTHVVQQRSGAVDGTDIGGGVSVSDPSDRYERAADDAATKVASGGTRVVGSDGVSSPTTATTAQREAVPGEEEKEETAQGLWAQREAGPEENPEELEGR
jgi:hypothetical protein